jgi:hypothetical protein
MKTRHVLFAWFALTAGCAGGSTMRAAPGDSDTGDTPVSLAPEPETTSPEPAPQPSESPTPAVGATQDTASTKGYAAYGDTAAASSNLEIRRIGQWTHTGVREAQRLVIQDANAWAQFWSELGVGVRPAVDFTRDVVVAVAAGERSSGGNEIAVTRVSQESGELRVEVTETVPGPNCITSTALTQPVDVVVVRAVKPRSWSFTEQKEVKACRP